MQPLKLVIYGRFWDTQIYSGRLYLFSRDGAIQGVAWDALIRQFEIDEALVLPLRLAFTRSDYLYGSKWDLVFSDRDIKGVIQGKFEALAQRELVVDSGRLHRATLARQDNPLPFPHSDATIYARTLYVASSRGVHSASCRRGLKYFVSTRPDRIWDGPASTVRGLYGSLALSAGDEGLFEYSLDHDGDGIFSTRNGANPRHLSRDHCTSCDWNYFSIFGSSHLSDGFMALFTNEPVDGSGEREREFYGVRTATELFGTHGYAWGFQDKLYQYQRDRIQVMRYQPWDGEPDRVFQPIGVIPVASWKGGLVSAQVALFGTVVECDSALVVLGSDDAVWTLPGEPINWRVFPRSKHYENQLHVVFEDRLEIYSFNHDYFVDQDAKLAGARLPAARRR